MTRESYELQSWECQGLCFLRRAETVAIAQPIRQIGGIAPTMVARIRVCVPAPMSNSKAFDTAPVLPNWSSALKENVSVKPNLKPGSGTEKVSNQVLSVALKAKGRVKVPLEFVYEAVTTPPTPGLKALPLG